MVLFLGLVVEDEPSELSYSSAYEIFVGPPPSFIGVKIAPYMHNVGICSMYYAHIRTCTHIPTTVTTT